MTNIVQTLAVLVTLVAGTVAASGLGRGRCGPAHIRITSRVPNPPHPSVGVGSEIPAQRSVGPVKEHGEPSRQPPRPRAPPLGKDRSDAFAALVRPATCNAASGTADRPVQWLSAREPPALGLGVGR